jgi:hypothetical protein
MSECFGSGFVRKETRETEGGKKCLRRTEWTFKKIEEKKGQSNKIEKKMGGGVH